MRRKKLVPFLSSLSWAALLLGCGGDHGSDPAQPVPEPTPVQVTAALVARVERPAYTEVTGTVQARRSVSLSPRIMSRILSVHGEEGAPVKRGQILIELDSRESASALETAKAAKLEAESAREQAQHNLESAMASRELAETTFARIEELVKKESVTQQEYDRASAELRSARAAVAAAESMIEVTNASRARAESAIATAVIQLGYSRIESPLNGVITRRLEDPGSLGMPGQPILLIEQSTGYRLEVAVPEALIGTLKIGEAVPAHIESLGQAAALEGRIAETASRVDPGSRTFTLKLDIADHPLLRSGMHGSAMLISGQRSFLTVPAKAVLERGQIRSVLVVAEGIARVRLVTLGAQEEGSYEVLSGLEAGERVVVSRPDLVDGTPISVQAEAGASDSETDDREGVGS